MSGIVLASRKDWAFYEKDLISREEIGVETREGRTYQMWSCQRAVAGLARVVKLIQAIAMTLFTLCLALIDSGVRDLWRQALSGKETIVLLSPLSKKNPPRDKPEPTPDKDTKSKDIPSPQKEELPAEISSSSSVESEHSSEYGVDEDSLSATSDSGSDEFPPLEFTKKPDASKNPFADLFSEGLTSSSSEETGSSSGSSTGSESEGIDFSDSGEGNVGRASDKDSIDFGLGDFGIGNLLAALDSLNEEADFRAHPQYPKLLDQRKKIYSLLQEKPKEASEAFLSEFIESCLSVHGKHPAWESLKSAYEKTQNQKRSSWEVPELFYRASGLLKDYKIATDIDKVQRKILSPIPLDVSVIKNDAKSPGKVSIGDQQIGRCTLSVRSAQGIRETMEDEDLATLLSIERPQGALNVPCFAVFDGHGGNECSKFLRDNFAGYMTRELSSIGELNDLTISNAIKMAFAKANTAFLRQDELVMSGSTAVVALIINGALWIANSGDARAVLGDAGTAVQLSRDAKPTKPEFAKGVKSRGGWVLGNRVNGILATARAFGDRVVLGVTARPQIRKFDLTQAQENKRFLILACDGLFDVVGSEEAVELIKDTKSASAAARELFDLAFERGTTDNVTVMVIQV